MTKNFRQEIIDMLRQSLSQAESGRDMAIEKGRQHPVGSYDRHHWGTIAAGWHAEALRVQERLAELGAGVAPPRQEPPQAATWEVG